MADKKTLLGIALGIGGTLAAPFALPIVGSVARPLVKGILKTSLLAGEKIRERVLLAAEDLSDLVAEVRVEVQDELARRGPPRRAEPEPAPDGEANGVHPPPHSGVPS